MNQSYVTPLPILIAAQQGKFEEVIVLAALQVDVNVQSHHDIDHNRKEYASLRTPLHYAVLYENFEAIKFLCENGARVDIPDAEGWTSANLGLNATNLQIQQFFLSVIIQENQGKIPRKYTISLEKEISEQIARIMELENQINDLKKKIGWKNQPVKNQSKSLFFPPSSPYVRATRREKINRELSSQPNNVIAEKHVPPLKRVKR